MTSPARSLDTVAVRRELDAGGVVLLATDTLPGLHARLDRPEALARLRALKGRAADKPFLVLAASCTDALGLLAGEANAWFSYLRRCWPGPFTLILPAAGDVPAAVRGAGGGVAVRVPERPPLRKLLSVTGPLASTSANATGDAPARTLAAAAARFPDLGVWSDGHPEPEAGAASALVDLTPGEPRVLRAGPRPLPPWSEEA